MDNQPPQSADDLQIQWLDKPEEHDYPAAVSYLSLLIDEKVVANLVDSLRQSQMRQFKAKDILRASNVTMLGINNAHVQRNTNKMIQGKPLSPILLVRDEIRRDLIIADGYHRLCAVYHINEDAFIPCQIVALTAS